MTVLREGVVGGALNVFFIYKFLRILTQPFNETDAFKLGIIDERGKILKKHRKLKTQEEKDAYTLMHRLVWKLKRLMEKIPFGKSRLASYAAALWLIKENKDDSISEEELQESFLSFLETDWENDALILKENYEGDLDKKTFSNLREDHMKPDKKGHNLPPHLAKFFDKKGNLKKDAADRITKGRKERGVKITDRTPDWMFKEIAPPGWEGTVKAMKKKKGIDNPYALAWHMHNKGMKPNIPEELGEIMQEAVLVDRDYKYDGKVIKISRKNFSKVHRDFKNSTKGKEMMMTYDNKIGTVLVPVEFTEEVELDERYYFNIGRGVYYMSPDSHKIDHKKEVKDGYPNAKEVLSSTKQASDYVAKKNNIKEGWKKGKYTIKDKNGKILGTYSSGGKAQKAMDDLMQKGDYDKLEVSIVEEVEEDVDEKKIMKLKIKPKKVKKMKDLRLYGRSPSKKKSSSSSSPSQFAFGISRKGGGGAGAGYGSTVTGKARRPITFGEEEINEKEVAVQPTVDNLKQIVKDKQNAVFMFKDGKARVDLFSASALMGVYNALKPATRKKFETMIKTKGGFMKSIDFAMKMAKEEVSPQDLFKESPPFPEEMDPTDHVKKKDDKYVIVAPSGKVVKTFDDKKDADQWAIDNHDTVMKEQLITNFKSFITEGRPSLDPDYVPSATLTDKMRAKLLSTQKKLYSSKDIESMARKYKQKLVGDPVGGKSWGGDWEIVLRNGISLSYEYGSNMTNIKGWKFDRKAIQNYIGKYANEHETPRDYAPMGGKVLVGGLEAAFEVISEEVELDESISLQIKMALSDVNLKGTWKNNKVYVKKKDVKKAEKALKGNVYYKGKTPSVIGEDAPANSVAGGNVNLDPFKKKRKNAKVETETFAGEKVFVVSPDVYYQSRLGKSRYLRYEKFVGNDKLGEAIRQYGKENPKAAIILKNSMNGAMLYLKYGKK